MSRKFVNEDIGLAIAYYLPQQHDAKYTVEINHFGTLKEVTRIFGEIANDYCYRPSEINKSGRLDVSIWEWTEERYQRVHYYD